MNEKEIFKTTAIIEDVVKSINGMYIIDRFAENNESLNLSINIKCGPPCLVRFVTQKDENGFIVYISNLFTNIPKEKYYRVLEACNLVNISAKYFRFFVNEENNLSVISVVSNHISLELISTIMLERLLILFDILNSNYGIFMKALYSDEELSNNT